MLEINEFLEYYNSLKDTQCNIKGKWINAEPLPFPNGFLQKDYWKNRWEWIKDSYFVIMGKAHVVTWNIKRQRGDIRKNK